MEATLNPGVTGAKRASWETSNPRAMLIRVMRANPPPRGNKELWYAKGLAEVHDDLSYLPPIYQYWFTNTLVSIEDAEGETSQTRQRSAAAKQEATERTREQVARTSSNLVDQIVLLNLIQPNGKRLRDCTGVECGKFGGLFKKLERCGERRVGDVHSEEEVRQMLRG